MLLLHLQISSAARRCCWAGGCGLGSRQGQAGRWCRTAGGAAGAAGAGAHAGVRPPETACMSSGVQVRLAGRVGGRTGRARPGAPGDRQLGGLGSTIGCHPVEWHTRHDDMSLCCLHGVSTVQVFCWLRPPGALQVVPILWASPQRCWGMEEDAGLGLGALVGAAASPPCLNRVTSPSTQVGSLGSGLRPASPPFPRAAPLNFAPRPPSSSLQTRSAAVQAPRAVTPLHAPPEQVGTAHRMARPVCRLHTPRVCCIAQCRIV